MSRELFSNIDEVKAFIKQHPERVMRKQAYRVSINGQMRYVFAGNSDQAIAAVSRKITNVEVESVGLNELALVS